VKKTTIALLLTLSITLLIGCFNNPTSDNSGSTTQTPSDTIDSISTDGDTSSPIEISTPQITLDAFSYALDSDNGGFGKQVFECDNDELIVFGLVRSEEVNYSSLWILRLNQFGDTLWTKRYPYFYLSEKGKAVDKCDDGGFIVTGRTVAHVESVSELALMKLDNEGNQIWLNQYKGAQAAGRSVVEDKDGNFIITGYYKSDPSTTRDIRTTKVTSSGELIWVRDFIKTGYNVDEGHEVIVTENNDYAVFGFTDFGDDNGLWFAIYNPDGDTLLMRSDYCSNGLEILFPYSVIQSHDGCFYITGTRPSYDKIFLIKIDMKGDIVWEVEYGSGDRYVGNSIIESSNGDILVTGWRNVELVGISKQLTLMKFSSDGNFQDELTIGKYGEELMGYSVIESESGGYIITGEVELNNSRLDQMFLIKTTEDFKTVPIVDLTN
jgi:hypothetical protein